MKDCIEKIVSKWGFEKTVDDCLVVFERFYRHIYFSVTLDRDIIKVLARAKDEDNRLCQFQHSFCERDFFSYDVITAEVVFKSECLEYALKDVIKSFLDRFFKYDLFHDIDKWEKIEYINQILKPFNFKDETQETQITSNES